MGSFLRRPAHFAAVLAALAAAGAAHAQTPDETATVTTGATMSVSDPQSIGLTQNLTFSLQPQNFTTGLTITSSQLNGLNANFNLNGVQTASIAIPATFDVVRVDGGDSITVRTVGSVTDIAGDNGQVAGIVSGGFFNNPVTVVGAIDAGVLSFNVGGAITIANNLVPGQYHGVLTVIAQYN